MTTPTTPAKPAAHHASHARHELSVCAQVSLRYEADHLLPWLAYHSLLGVDFQRYREFITFHTEYVYPEVRSLPSLDRSRQSRA